MEIEKRYKRFESLLASAGQGHLLKWWPELQATERKTLLDEIEAVSWDLLKSVIPTHVLRKPHETASPHFEPARVHESAVDGSCEVDLESDKAEGRRLLAEGKVAAMTVAGGQGTRLGFEGPKGLVPVTPVGGKTLFELFALNVDAARRRYGAPIPWYIMTSPANHDSTVAYFAGQNNFGLPSTDIRFFSQGMLPAFDFQGRALLSARHRLALAPDGHGGSLKALVQSGALADMQARGVRIISYFQIDNPLVKPFDPLFIGLHARTGSEMATKVSAKSDDLERVGNVCVQDGRVTVIEYSEFPESVARARDHQGRRKFDAGNLAIHLLDVDFVERVIAHSFQLPFRRAEKAVPYLDDNGRLQQPEKPNAVKLETFIFDVLPMARNPLVLKVDRAEEFSPVKNATGVDSLESSRRDQIARACRWLETAGIRVPRKPDGSPDVAIAISPRFALDAEELRLKAAHIPQLTAGASVFLE